jgi:hypothetical protein
MTLDVDTEARLPQLFGAVSVALARTFRLIDADIKAVHTVEWERAFQLFRQLI